MWCWYPGVAAHVGPDIELDSAWQAWHSATALSEAMAGQPTGKTIMYKKLISLKQE